MSEPITASIIIGLAASKFAETGAAKAAEKLVEGLWAKLKTRFKGRKKAEEALIQLAAAKGDDPKAKANLVRVLDGEMFEDDDFAEQLQQTAQQILNIQNQSQTQNQTTFNIDARDKARVNAVGELKATTVNFGDQK